MKNVLTRKNILNNDKDWRAILDSNPNYSVFQSPDWAHCMERCLEGYKSRPFIFEFSDGTRVIWPMLERSVGGDLLGLEAMPRGLYGRPVILGEWSPEKGKEILRSILTGRYTVLQYAENPLLSHIDFVLPKGIAQEVLDVETHVLELAPSWDVMWEKRFSSRMRNKMRKAEREGLEVRRGSTQQDVEKFCSLYELSSKRWGYNHPPYPPHFFHNLIDCAFDRLWLVLVEEQDRVVAGGIFVEDNHAVLYWFGAMDSAVKHIYPTYFMFGYIIREAVEKGKKYLNMGASGDLEGVRQFKEMWHAEPVPYKIFTFKRELLVGQVDKIKRILRRVWRKVYG